MIQKQKNVHITLSPDSHKKLRVLVALKDTTIKAYLKDLVEADLEKMSKKHGDV